MAEIFNNKYFKGEGYISADVSGVVWSKKLMMVMMENT